MTVAVQDLDIEHAAPVQGNQYNIPFRYWGDQHLRVRFKLSTTPVSFSADLAVDVGYSVTPSGLSYAGGTLTLLAAVPANATHLAIEARTVRAQDTALPAVARHYEQALDRVTMIAQEMGVEVDSFDERFEGIDEAAAAADASATAAAASATAAQTAEANAETAETNAETAQAGAETARTGAEAARDQVVGRIGNLSLYDSRITAAADTIDASVTQLITGGDAAEGDGGHARWKSVGAEPAHPGKFSSNAGARWWELVPEDWGASGHALGVRGDDTADDTAAVQNALDYAKATHAAITFRKGAICRVSNLAVSEMRSLVLRSVAGLGTQNEGGSCVFKYYGAAGGVMLLLAGVVQATIEGISFQKGDADPAAYVRTNYVVGWGTTSIDIDKVLFEGGGKTDGAVGFDVGPDAVSNNADFNWGRVEFRGIQTGLRLNHEQQVGFHFEYVRAMGCARPFDIVNGGNLKIGTLNCTDNDTVLYARGGGANLGALTIDNAHIEMSAPSATAKFLDIASTGSLGWHVVLNNPIVTTNYTGTFISIGQATHVICNGGFLPVAGTIDLAGTEDGGDAVFVMVGGRYGGTWTTNDWGYYRHIAPMVSPSGGASPFGGTIVLRNGKALGHDVEKMPASQRRTFYMPAHRPGGSTVTRQLPPDALVTSIEFSVEAVGSANLADKIRLALAGQDLAEFVIGTPGARVLSWRVNDLDAGDTDHAALGAPAVTAAIAGDPNLRAIISAGTPAQVKSATIHVVVEYVVKSAMATGLDP